MASLSSLIAAIDASLASNDGHSYTNAIKRGLSTSSPDRLPSAADRRSLAIHAVTRVSFENALLLPVSSASVSGMETALCSLPPGTTLDGAADSLLREFIFMHLVDTVGDYVSAAKILASKRMESSDDDTSNSSPYIVSPADRADAHLRVAECYLFADPSSHLPEADAAVSKAGQAVDAIPLEDRGEHAPIIMRYKSAVARVLDLNRRFGSASAQYYELSKAEGMSSEDAQRFLGLAATCSVLAKDGPGKRRLLSMITKDKRLVEIEKIEEFMNHPALLRTMSTGHIVRRVGGASREWEEFVSSLKDHQKIVTGDGMTIPGKALLEHNVMAAGKIYESVYLQKLAGLLGVDRALAERAIAAMICDGRLAASIDQVDGVLTFYDELSEISGSFLESRMGNKDGEGKGATAGRGAVAIAKPGMGSIIGVVELLRWDDAITTTCIQLNKITEVIESNHG